MKFSIILTFVVTMVVVFLFSSWLIPCDEIFAPEGMFNEYYCEQPNSIGFFLRNKLGPKPPDIIQYGY